MSLLNRNQIRPLNEKLPVAAASTGNVNVSSAPSAIDGVTLASGDRVLLKNQTTGSENGVYTFNGAASALTRSEDFNENINPGNSDSRNQVYAGAYVFVEAGDSNARTYWEVTNATPPDIGTDNITFSDFTITTPHFQASRFLGAIGTPTATPTDISDYIGLGSNLDPDTSATGNRIFTSNAAVTTSGHVAILGGGAVNNDLASSPQTSHTVTGSDHAVIAGGGTSNSGASFSGHSITSSPHAAILGGGSTADSGHSIDASDFAVIVGGGSATGAGHTISGSSDYSAIVGGNTNEITNGSFYAFIGTGISNSIDSGDYSSIVSADNGTVDGNYNFIGTGEDPSIIGGSTYSSVLNGNTNSIDGSQYSTILNGAGHNIGEVGGGVAYGAILGGFTNTISLGADYSTIINGQSHQSDVSYATIAGAGEGLGRSYGEVVISNGSTELTPGGNQTSFLVFYGSGTVPPTSSSINVDLTLDNSAEVINVPSGSAVHLKLTSIFRVDPAYSNGTTSEVATIEQAFTVNNSGAVAAYSSGSVITVLGTNLAAVNVDLTYSILTGTNTLQPRINVEALPSFLSATGQNFTITMKAELTLASF